MNITDTPTQREADAISDELLMQYADGELDPASESEILKRLEGSAVAQRKLASIVAIGSFVRASTENDSRGDGIAASVMAAIADDHRVDSEEPSKPRFDRLPRDDARRPANDNSRGIFAIAGIAAAAAAALFVWSKDVPVDDELASAAPVPEAPLMTAMGARLDAGAAPTASASLETEGEDGEMAVEVASVEFGTQLGSVFYVPGDGAATAVVWINDVGEDQ